VDRESSERGDMNCEQARLAWHRRCDDGVADPAVDEHLRVCDDCRAYHRQMDAIEGALDELRADTESIVSRRLDRKSQLQRRTWFSTVLPLARIAAVLAVAAALAWYFASTRFTNQQSGTDRLTNSSNNEDETVATIVPPPDDVTEITLQGESASRYLAVATPTSRPGVKLFWLYPTVGESPTSDPS